jgi:hypothetical protein
MSNEQGNGDNPAQEESYKRKDRGRFEENSFTISRPENTKKTGRFEIKEVLVLNMRLPQFPFVSFSLCNIQDIFKNGVLISASICHII